MDRMKLIEMYPKWWKTPEQLNDGAIFRDLLISAGVKQVRLPWGNDASFNLSLDRAFIGSYGDRWISPLVEKLTENIPASILRTEICAIVWDMFFTKWDKMWDTLKFTYDPIENYSMTEIMTADERKRYYGKTNTRTDNLTSRNSGTNRTDPNLTDTESVNNYGFNTTAENGEPSEKHTTQKTGNSIDTVDVSKIDTGTQSYVDGGSDREEHSYTLTRTGNIGTVTAQDMIKQEREILVFDYFYDVVFPDLLRVLTIKIY